MTGAHHERAELRLRSVRELIAELAQLENASRSTTALFSEGDTDGAWPRTRDGRPVAVVNLYATRRHAFNRDAVRTLKVLRVLAAGLAAAYLQERHHATNLTDALESSRRVAVARGILMSRHPLTQEHAFNLLRTSSQDTNRKPRDLAEDVLAEGDLPA